MASALEQFVNTVRTSSTHGNYRELYQNLSKSYEALNKNVQHLDNVLETLDFHEHSLGVLAVLVAKFSNPNAGAQDNRFIQAQEFIMNCDQEQIKVAPDMFTELCHLLTAHLIEQKQPLKGIDLLQFAINRLNNYSTWLTSIHADLCQLCLVAQCFKPAIKLLDVDIIDIWSEVSTKVSQNPNGSQFDAKYFLLYYYYGGKIYLAVRNLERALYFFEVALTTPAHAVSHIMLESYKKFILVSLLLHGKMQPAPKYASKVVARFIKPLSQPYHDLANAFTSNNHAELNSVINKHSEAFNRDKNMGLVKQVSSVLYKKNIQRLTKTFLTLSLSDVASRVGLPGPSDAEKYILDMIENGQIFATINQKDGMVVFHDEPEKFSGPQVLKSLEDQLTMCIDLDNRIFVMDEGIQVNPQYVKKSAGLQDDEQPSKSTYAM